MADTKPNITIKNINILSKYNNNFFTAGEYSYSAGLPKLRFHTGKEKIRIGKFCSISTEVTFFLAGNHATDRVSTFPFCSFAHDWPGAPGEHTYSNGDIDVGNDVWIGAGATILSGITIGDGAVIGTQALVTKDVPPYAIVGGNPAKIIRYRFEPEIIAKLQALAWWDWPKEKIQANIAIIAAGKPEELLALQEKQIVDA